MLWCFYDSSIGYKTADSLTWKQSLTYTSSSLPTVRCYSSWQLNAAKKMNSTVHPYESIGGVLISLLLALSP